MESNYENSLIWLRCTHMPSNTSSIIWECDPPITMQDIKRRSHIHDARPALWKISNFGQCVVFRWVCVSIRYSFVERAGTNAMHSLSFALCVGIFVHAQKCALSSTHECTRQKDARHSQSALHQRQTHAEHAGPTPETRGAHAVYSLYVCRLRCSEHLAHT